MSQTPTIATPSSPQSLPWTKVQVWLPLLALAVLWADLIRQLGHTWSSSDQYAYGWFVPILSAGLLWRNWSTRPNAKPQQTPIWMALGMGLAMLLLLPARILHEVNPDWPLASWLLTPPVVAITLFVVFQAGGWTWVRHFAFPITFILVAVQWPYRIEQGLIQGLMKVVAAIGVEILGLLNIPALQRGNLIEIDTGVLGIDEACSGIRSFQTTIMAALFLGEQYRLPWLRRLGMLFGGLFIAFSLNIVRAVLLSWNAAVSGMGAVDKWHDPAGLGIVVVCFICLWSAAAWLGRNTPPVSTLATQEPSLAPRLLPPPLAYTFSAWIAVVFVCNWYWYRPKVDLGTPAVRWTVALPTNAPTFSTVELPPRSLKLLNFDEGITGSWRTPEGIKWDVYWFRWNPRSIAHVLHARVHRPDRCLPASGVQLMDDAGIAEFEVQGFSLPIRRYVYQHEGKPWHVFFCLWEDGSEKQAGMSTMYGERVRAAVAGRKALGQQTLQVLVQGHQSLPEAETELRRILPEIITVTNPPPFEQKGAKVAKNARVMTDSDP